MKRLVWLLLLGMVCGVQGAFLQCLREGEKPFYYDERPPRSIHIGKETAFVIDKGQAEIVIEAEAYHSVQYAASTLKQYLEKRIGGEVPIVHAPTEGKVSFYIGISKWSKAAGIDESKLCRDAFYIRTVGKAVYIVGCDDKEENLQRNDERGGVWGTLQEHASTFGVQDFLERFCGIRFYFPYEEGVYIPAQSPVAVPEIDIFDRPDFEARNVSSYCGMGEDEKSKEPTLNASLSAAKNIFTKRNRLQTKYIANCHGLSRLELTERFYEAHPEYFALRTDGSRTVLPSMGHVPQLCYSSGIFEELKKDAIAVLKKESPQTRGLKRDRWDPTGQLPGLVFGCMSQDGFYACTCEKCKPHFATEQGASELVWSRVAEVADYVKKELGEGYYVSNMAYYPCAPVPSFQLPDNVLVMLALRGPWIVDEREKFQAEQKTVRAWNQKVGYKTWLWNYAGKYGAMCIYGVPNCVPRAVGKYYQSMKNDICGAFMESETDRFIYNHMNFYVFGKVAWDNDVDVDALLKEYYTLMFGAAADVVESIFDDFENTWLTKIAGRSVDTPLGPVASPPSDNELWEKVYSPAHIKELIGKFDAAEKLTAGNAADLKHVKYVRAKFLEPLLERQREYMSQNDTLASFGASLPATLYLTQFKTSDPLNLRTQVDVALTETDFCVTFRCEEPDMEHVIQPQRDMDDGQIWADNDVEVFVDPTGEGKSYYQLLINSAGSLCDIYGISLGKKIHHDKSWNSEAAVEIGKWEKGWTASVRIPRSSFKAAFNPDGFIANFSRNRATTTDGSRLYSWSPFLVRVFNDLEHFGHLYPNRREPVNVVPNPDFNDAASGRTLCRTWILDATVPEGCKAELDKSTFIAGYQSLKLSNSNDQEQFLFKINCELTKYLKPNRKYRVSYFVKTDNVKPLTSHGGFCLGMWHKKNYWWPSNKIVGTHPWFKQTFEFTSDANCPDEKAYLKPVLFQCTGTAWFDHVCVEEVE